MQFHPLDEIGKERLSGGTLGRVGTPMRQMRAPAMQAHESIDLFGATPASSPPESSAHAPIAIGWVQPDNGLDRLTHQALVCEPALLELGTSIVPGSAHTKEATERANGVLGVVLMSGINHGMALFRWNSLQAFFSKANSSS